MTRAIVAGVRTTPAPAVCDSDAALEGHVRMVRAEYGDMPGLRLTLSQAARLFGLTVKESERVLSLLTDEGFVVCDVTGMYRRHE